MNAIDLLAIAFTLSALGNVVLFLALREARKDLADITELLALFDSFNTKAQNDLSQNS